MCLIKILKSLFLRKQMYLKMIVFDLDGTLADCEHRRHFVDPIKAGLTWGGVEGDYEGNWTKNGLSVKFTPDWKAFYEACDKDIPIEPTIHIYTQLMASHEIQIWSGRLELEREKTIDWLHKHLDLDFYSDKCCPVLKMRPIGNSEPDDQLKEMWLLDANILDGKTIDFVFDDRPKVVRMWRRRGIFVFNCCQHDKEF